MYGGDRLYQDLKRETTMKQPSKPARLTFAAPARVWYRTAEGLWASRPWTKQEVEDYRRIGGWFNTARTHAEPGVFDPAMRAEGRENTKQLTRVSMRFIDDAIDKLTPRERDQLVRRLT